MDFYNIIVVEKKDGSFELRPDWKVGRSKDLMTRGGQFYAVWDEEAKMWSTDIYDVQRLVDADLHRVADEQRDRTGIDYKVATLRSNNTKLWDSFISFVRNSGNNSHTLDAKLMFADTESKKEDYASKRLPYSMAPGSHEAWDTIVGTLYSTEERAKIEWAIGAVISGDSKQIQKFLVFYGPPGSGKSTILNIIEMLFEGYTAVFDARELVGNNNSFATSAFKSNPLVGIQHDGDLSRISDNTKLNSIVSHEIMGVNEKYKAVVEMRSNAFLFMGTNLPVKITDAKAGIIRRLIDVVPTGQTFEYKLYLDLMERVQHELGAIAAHCLERYRAMGKNYYGSYRPTEMMLQTDAFYNFVEAHYDIFKDQAFVTLVQAWGLYKEYCEDSGISTDKRLMRYKFREELKNYFDNFDTRTRIDGEQVRNVYSGFKALAQTPPTAEIPSKPEGLYRIELAAQASVFEETYSAQPAQYAKDDGTPTQMWGNVTTTLANLDTTKLHYVALPESHIVIDFDLRDETGEKSLERSIEAASKWAPTYAEVSKSGKGIHLHYIYNGDVHELAPEYAEHIEIKTFLGNASLRRRFTRCNNMTIAPLSGRLPKKEKKPVLSAKTIGSERGLRDMIQRNLQKEFHASTKSSIDFIKTILDQAYDEGLAYDVSDMQSRILTFAFMSSNQKEYCVKMVQQMKFVGQNSLDDVEPDIHTEPPVEQKTDDLVFFDVEVYPNLFVICWKYSGSDDVVTMVNPTPQDVERLFDMKLVGFNNRRYDNHILYGRFLGMTNEALYKLSERIINGNDRSVLFAEAYNISYADIYDFSSKKQGLKKFQIELGIYHHELDIPWDEPVPENLWPSVVEYCTNDVRSTEAVFESRRQDYIARQILASISGLSINHTTQAHTARIIFGKDKDASKRFKYTKLETMFPGYEYSFGKSTYRGEEPGEGGYVYAEPGMYTDVAVLDVASMHPTSIIELDLFGPYTQNFKDLLDARLAIKRKDYDAASQMLDGKLFPYLTDATDEYDIGAAEDLSYALKIVINIVYGLTSAKFQNPFFDIRNKDNIVAKRGALFMIDLKHAVQEQGYKVVHIKTDSIKIPGATPEIIEFVTEFGRKYGYDFEHEATYEKFCLVNDAVYIAREGDKWTAVGAQFQHPYVFKTLFSGEELTFNDYCETRNVTKGTMYLSQDEATSMIHVGRTGSFVPVIEGGYDLLRVHDGKSYSVAGTKGFKWVTREMAQQRDLDYLVHMIDLSYFDTLATKAREAIMKYNPHDFEWFVS